MFRLTLDATGFQNFHTGVGRYAYNLITHLVAVDSSIRLTILVSKSLDANHAIMHFAAAHDNVRIVKIRAGVLGPTRDIRFLLPTTRYDIYHCLNASLPLSLHRNTVVTVHDCIYIEYPYFFGRLARVKKLYLEHILKHVAKRASRIIAVSHCTASSFTKLYGALRPTPLPITVIHEASTSTLGSASSVKAPITPETQEIIRTPFFFYYGEFRPHKNITRLIAAFSLLKKRLREHVGASSLNSNVQLILAGSSHSSYQLPPLPQGVRYIGPIRDTTLAQLLPRAVALCFISLCEGFGLPILEAMQCGTPVIASNISAMPEVAGDAAILVDPYHEGQVATAMHRLYTDSDLRLHYIKQGKERVRQFSWERNAQETLAVYRTMLP